MNESLTFRFPKSLRLRNRRDYQRMTRGVQHVMGEWMIIDFRQVHHPVSRLGITVTRRYGKAHERNRFKRIVREAFRLSVYLLPKGVDILIKPRPSAKRATMQEIQKELLLILSIKPL